MKKFASVIYFLEILTFKTNLLTFFMYFKFLEDRIGTKGKEKKFSFKK